MPDEFVRCVRKLLGDGKSRDSAYAICTEQYKKSHGGQTPQQAAGEADLWELIDMPDGEREAALGTAERNNWPDSCFAWIEAGGSKDDEGKTTPRSLRHLPYKNPDGSLNAAHVRAALQAIGGARTGKPMSVPAAARKKIQAAAKALGIGEYAEAEGDENELQVESENVREQAMISEAEFDEVSQAFEFDVIRAGITRNGKREYTREALQTAAPRYAGAQMFLDHSTESEDRERPARSVRDLAAVIESAWYADGAVHARAKVVDPGWFPKLATCWPHIGISADQMVSGRKAEADGKERLIVEAIESVRCVDFVTRANAGGAVSRIIESYNANEGSEDDVDLKELTVEQLREARPDLIKELTKEDEPDPPATISEEKIREIVVQEINGAKDSLTDESAKQIAREVLALRCEPKISRIVKDASLHPVVEQRVRDELSGYAHEDDAELRKHVEAVIEKERDHAARLTEGVIGMGAPPDPDDDDEEARKAKAEKAKEGRDKFAQG